MKLTRALLGFGLALPALALATGAADAHRRWLLPSVTQLSGDTGLVSVDAAISNDLFTFDHHAAPLDDLSVTGPDGQAVQATIIGSGEYRSVFDVPLKRQGTYRIALASDGMMGSYMLNGERKRWRGSVEAAKTAIPAGATEVRLTPMAARTETFVTLGAPTPVKAVGRGLEMVPVTHPNDLVTGEAAQMRFLLDGKPVAGLEVEFVKGDTRYRDDAGIVRLTTDANGLVTLTAPQAGMYFLETSQGGGPGADAPRAGPGAGAATRPAGGEGARRVSYSAVLEFLPA